jgi:hypothetical protein
MFKLYGLFYLYNDDNNNEPTMPMKTMAIILTTPTMTMLRTTMIMIH